MATVRVFVREGVPPTAEEIRLFRERAREELARLDDFDDGLVSFDEDCPPLTFEQLAKFVRPHVPAMQPA